jgi:diadenosine tetraphosphate (Ap4A) HIT family hydrolase
LEKCIGCEIVLGRLNTPGGIIYEDEHWTVTHSVASNGAPLKGMLILQPKRHCTHLADLESEEVENLGFILRNTCKAIDAILHPMKAYACSFGEGVKHVHFMIVPRMPGMPIGAELLKQVLEEQKWVCSFEEASDLAIKIHNKLDLLLCELNDEEIRL